jgi:hypothetical protein
VSSSSADRFLDRLLDAFPNGIKRVVLSAIFFKITPALIPFGQWTEQIEKFAFLLEIHRIKNHWHCLICPILWRALALGSYTPRM